MSTNISDIVKKIDITDNTNKTKDNKYLFKQVI